MTTYYLDSNGSDTSPYDTWAKAANAIATLHAIDGAGDIIYVSDNHSEQITASTSHLFAGTLAAPTKIICADDTSGEPPTTAALTALFDAQGSNDSRDIEGSVYVYGCIFQTPAGGNNGDIALNEDGAAIQIYEKCIFRTIGTGTVNYISISTTGNSAQGIVSWKDCDIKFGGTGGNITVKGGTFNWSGGSIESGSASPTGGGLIEATNVGESSTVHVSGIDLSNMGATADIFYPLNASSSLFGVIRNCKLPGSWTGALMGNTGAPESRFELYNCDSGDTNYNLWVEDGAGSIVDETTIVRTGGASDGTTQLSWKMVTHATDSSEEAFPLKSPEIVQWNETVGSSITATLEIVHDSQGAGTGSDFQDDEIWAEFQYLGTSGFPLGTFISDHRADLLATAADHANSAETWTTTGLSTPVKQYLTASFTPQEKGFVHAVVHFGKKNKTVYVDPKIEIT